MAKSKLARQKSARLVPPKEQLREQVDQLSATSQEIAQNQNYADGMGHISIVLDALSIARTSLLHSHDFLSRYNVSESMHSYMELTAAMIKEAQGAMQQALGLALIGWGSIEVKPAEELKKLGNTIEARLKACEENEKRLTESLEKLTGLAMGVSHGR